MISNIWDEFNPSTRLKIYIWTEDQETFVENIFFISYPSGPFKKFPCVYRWKIDSLDLCK